MIYRIISVVLLTVLSISSCVGKPASPSATAAPIVLTSAIFLAAITRNIAGDSLAVESLLLAGAEYEHFLELLLENAEGERSVWH